MGFPEMLNLYHSPLNKYLSAFTIPSFFGRIFIYLFIYLFIFFTPAITKRIS